MSNLAGQIALQQRPSGLPVMRQRWRDLLFIHFPIEPGRIQPLLPPGLAVDTFPDETGREMAWVGLIPFRMEGVRPVGLPAVPGLSDFPETNVRTYVIGPDGRPGVWFFSLDAGNDFACRIARRSFSLPYHHASMAVERKGRKLEFRSQRVDETAMSNINAETLGEPRPAEPGSLDFFLVERYLLYAYRNGRLFAGQVHHEPYQIQPARLVCLQETLVSTNGLEVGHHIQPCYAEGVDVDVFRLLPCPS